MNKTISELISDQQSKQFAVNAGRLVHSQLQFVNRYPELMNKIKTVPGLDAFFADNSQTEVPVAAMLNNRFVSRRIDRLVINDTTKTIKILDYKTDINPDEFYDKYVLQLTEYKEILSKIYQKYKIETYILWLHDWRLEQI